jgi:hypothetical protein
MTEEGSRLPDYISVKSYRNWVYISGCKLDPESCGFFSLRIGSNIPGVCSGKEGRIYRCGRDLPKGKQRSRTRKFW